MKYFVWPALDPSQLKMAEINGPKAGISRIFWLKSRSLGIQQRNHFMQMFNLDGMLKACKKI
jgi:hypothetical protein